MRTVIRWPSTISPMGRSSSFRSASAAVQLFERPGRGPVAGENQTLGSRFSECFGFGLFFPPRPGDLNQSRFSGAVLNSEEPRVRLGCPSRSTFSQAPRKLVVVDFGRKEYGYRTSWRGFSSTSGTYLNSTLGFANVSEMSKRGWWEGVGDKQPPPPCRLIVHC